MSVFERYLTLWVALCIVAGLSQVALNDTIMVFAFAPIVALLLGLSAITVPWGTLALSVALYIVVPVVAAQLLRRRLLAASGEPALKRLLDRLQPLSLVALLVTLTLLFGFQGKQILAQPLVIALLAIPILIQVYFNSGPCLFAQPHIWRTALHRRALSVDRRVQLFRIGGRRGHQPVRVPVRRGTCHRGWRFDRSANHAFGRLDRESFQGLVRERAVIEHPSLSRTHACLSRQANP